jgi:hypothetical protein
VAEDKKVIGEKKQTKIYRKGGRYYCAVCHAELLENKNCPGCHAEIDWERAGDNQTIPFFPG